MGAPTDPGTVAELNELVKHIWLFYRQMDAPVAADDLGLAGIAGLLVVLARHLQRRLGRLRSTAQEECPIQVAGQKLADPGGEAKRGLVRAGQRWREEKGYHGSTMGSLSASGAADKRNFDPLPSRLRPRPGPVS